MRGTTDLGVRRIMSAMFVSSLQLGVLEFSARDETLYSESPIVNYSANGLSIPFIEE